MPDDTLRDNVHAQPLVSVITPVYNGEAHLVQCIESVLAQTYQHWDTLIVDNCSTDRTSEIADWDHSSRVGFVFIVINAW